MWDLNIPLRKSIGIVLIQFRKTMCKKIIKQFAEATEISFQYCFPNKL